MIIKIHPIIYKGHHLTRLIGDYIIVRPLPTSARRDIWTPRLELLGLGFIKARDFNRVIDTRTETDVDLELDKESQKILDEEEDTRSKIVVNMYKRNKDDCFESVVVAVSENEKNIKVGDIIGHGSYVAIMRKAYTNYNHHLMLLERNQAYYAVDGDYYECQKKLDTIL